MTSKEAVTAFKELVQFDLNLKEEHEVEIVDLLIKIYGLEEAYKEVMEA